MKEVKIAAIATIITICLILSCAYAMPAHAENRPEFYPKLTVVAHTIRIEDHLWVVECQDKDGNIWGFYDDEHTWAEGDIANLLMMTVNEKEEEDEIVEVYREGYTENITEWLQNNGWH